MLFEILGVAIQQWTFLGYDNSQESLDNAAKILAANPDFEKKISLKHASSLREALTSSNDDDNADLCLETYEKFCRTKVLPLALLSLTYSYMFCASSKSKHAKEHRMTDTWYPFLCWTCRYSFTMCNPPFFEDSQQAQLNPKTDCGGKVRQVFFFFFLKKEEKTKDSAMTLPICFNLEFKLMPGISILKQQKSFQ